MGKKSSGSQPVAVTRTIRSVRRSPTPGMVALKVKTMFLRRMVLLPGPIHGCSSQDPSLFHVRSHARVPHSSTARISTSPARRPGSPHSGPKPCTLRRINTGGGISAAHHQCTKRTPARRPGWSDRIWQLLARCQYLLFH